MKVFLAILINAAILYAITYLLWENATMSIQAGIVLGCNDCAYTSLEALKTYFTGGIILWILNTIIRPILRILSLPLFFLFFGLVSFFINGVVLFLFSFIINKILIIPWVWYEINGIINFAIAVAIFTILNTLYSLLFFKK
jgi:putative membrane protein